MDDEPQTPTMTAEPLDPYAADQDETAGDEIDLNQDMGSDLFPWDEFGGHMVDGHLEYELPEDVVTKAIPIAFAKGDTPGHEFHGNQFETVTGRVNEVRPGDHVEFNAKKKGVLLSYDHEVPKGATPSESVELWRQNIMDGRHVVTKVEAQHYRTGAQTGRTGRMYTLTFDNGKTATIGIQSKLTVHRKIDP